MSENTQHEEVVITNGINVTEYGEIVSAVSGDAELAKFQFRAQNRWEDGGFNRTTIAGFYGAGEEHGTDGRAFDLEADEPPVILGGDRAPTPVEFLLHSLAACLTSAMVYKAAARGITVESVEATLSGDMDARSFLEISDEERRGYRNIQATFKVKSDASAEALKECAEFSPVLDVVSNGTAVSLRVEKA